MRTRDAQLQTRFNWNTEIYHLGDSKGTKNVLDNLVRVLEKMIKKFAFVLKWDPPAMHVCLKINIASDNFVSGKSGFIQKFYFSSTCTLLRISCLLNIYEFHIKKLTKLVNDD